MRFLTIRRPKIRVGALRRPSARKPEPTVARANPVPVAAETSTIADQMAAGGPAGGRRHAPGAPAPAPRPPPSHLPGVLTHGGVGRAACPGSQPRGRDSGVLGAQPCTQVPILGGWTTAPRVTTA